MAWRLAFLVKALILFEDDHLLVVNKPAGMNTHAPSPFAGEGFHEWLRHREPRWSRLAIIHRLDKETSGVMVFGKTALANRSLTEQFTQRAVHKKYRFLTDRPIDFQKRTMISSLVRVGEKYVSRPLHAGAERAETRFHVLETKSGRTLLEAEPITGRTHQIRVHAAAESFPILGDTLYGGTAAKRVCLHAVELTLKHPLTGGEMTFSTPEDFDSDARLELRELIMSARAENSRFQLQDTNAYRLIHGAADSWAGWYVERLGDYLLSQAEKSLNAAQEKELRQMMKIYNARGAYHKILTRHVRRMNVTQASPQLVLGEAAPGAFTILENGMQFELSFDEGYSVGLFLDQRDNRRRLLTNHVAADFPLFPEHVAGTEVLNSFAYTCGFSVCAAKAGARVTSLDLSKKYLEWGKRNFVLNKLDPTAHDFIYGDAFDWLRRLEKKGRAFDAVLLDPPTFSQSKSAGVFQAEKNFDRLVKAALPVLKPGGVLFASTNATRLEPEQFLETVNASISSAGRKILQQHYAPQPPDFPVHRDEPAYLKTVWMRVG
ncbi:MAG TPA: pseudouridine synthase [Verrucomicrobiae bacterium]|nr:pseudouridine synthase [Verrucomicrobiae bacterium]